MRLFVPICASILLLVSVGACVHGERQRSGELRATVNGVELAYEIVGEGEPILFIPSVVGDSFEPLMGEAALNGYMLIKYHPRGMGHSERAPVEGDSILGFQAVDAAAFLRHLGVEQAHIVGHSGGGTVAIILAIDEPDLVHSLVLLESGAPEIAGFDGREAMERFSDEFAPPPNGPSLLEAFSRTPRPSPGEAFMTWLAAAQDAEDGEERLSRWIPDVREQFENYFAWQDEWTAPEGYVINQSDLENISEPVLWVWSEERLGVSVVAYHYLQDAQPQMETVEIPGIGHGLHLQDPASVAAVISDFLAEHPMR